MFKHGYLWSIVEAEALLILKVAVKGGRGRDESSMVDVQKEL